jgi:hypothetical protein
MLPSETTCMYVIGNYNLYTGKNREEGKHFVTTGIAYSHPTCHWDRIFACDLSCFVGSKWHYDDCQPASDGNDNRVR